MATIIAGIDEGLDTSAHSFVEHDRPEETKGIDLEGRIDDDGDFIVAEFSAKHPVLGRSD